MSFGAVGWGGERRFAWALPICRADVRELVARRLELRGKGFRLIW